MLRNAPPLHTLLLLATAVVVCVTPVSFAGKGKSPGVCRGKNCDTSPPAVSIADPTAGEAITGATTVTGSAADNGEILSVRVNVDGDVAREATGSTSWNSVLDSTTYGNGVHVITVTASDTAGNVGAASVAVRIDNQPPEPPLPPPPPPDPSLPPEPPAPPPSAAAPVVAPPVAPGTVGGYVFREIDRDGVFETDELPLSDRHLFLFDGAGTYLQNTRTNASGWYEFTGLRDGSYHVEFAPAAWWAIRDELVPDTTGTLLPARAIQLSGTARSDIGWRPIVRSDDPSSPLSSYVGASGLTVQSFDDVVSARAIHDRLMEGSLVGSEAPFVTIRFDFAKSGSTSTIASSSNGGPYEDYRASSDLTYLAWLDGDNELFHEYGHAWSLYYAFIVQQDPSFSAYLRARGLQGDARVNSSYAWNVRELIAEDYRQLFGTASARSATQLNRELPPASEVPGLRDFLTTTLTARPSP